jgi:hypothetical protein
MRDAEHWQSLRCSHMGDVGLRHRGSRNNCHIEEDSSIFIAENLLPSSSGEP